MAFPTAGIIDTLTGATWDSTNNSLNPANGGRTTAPNPIGGVGIQTQSSGGYAFEFWRNAATYQECECRIEFTAGAGFLTRLWARMQQPSSSSNTIDGYMLNAAPGSSSQVYLIVNNVVSATLGTFTPSASATGFGIEVTGTGATVTVKVYEKISGTWTLTQTFTDSSGSRITAAGYLGVLGADTAGASRWTNFGGGTIVATTPAQISGSSSAAATGSLSLGTGTPPTFSLSSTATATGSLGLTAAGQLPLGQSTATATGTLDLTTTSAVGSRAAPGWLGMFITDTSGASIPLIAGGSNASATGSLSLLTPSARLISGSSNATATGTLVLRNTATAETRIATPTGLSSAKFGNSTLESAQFGNSFFQPAIDYPVS